MKKITLLIALLLLSQNSFADIFDRIAILTNAVNDIRATTNTCEKINKFPEKSFRRLHIELVLSKNPVICLLTGEYASSD